MEAGSLNTQVIEMQVFVHAAQTWLFVLLLANAVMTAHAARTVHVSIEGKELNVRTNIN